MHYYEKNMRQVFALVTSYVNPTHLTKDKASLCWKHTHAAWNRNE